MALSVSIVDNAPHVVGDRRMVVADVTFDSSYPTGGEVLSAADLRLTQVFAVVTAGEWGGYNVGFDHAAGKLMAFIGNNAAPDAEVAGATDLSTVSGRIVAFGY